MKGSTWGRALVLLAVTGMLVATTTGCVAVRTVEKKDRTDRVEIDLDDAARAEVEIDMGAGQLLVQDAASSAASLMEAEFAYSITSSKPEVSYDVRGELGRLRVRQPSGYFSGLGEDVYIWDIALARDVPLDLEVSVGAGETDLDLSDLDLRSLQLHMGAGDTKVDLTGQYQHPVEADITGGAGAITVRLPEDIGVRVSVDQGIGELIANGFTLKDGDYVNDAYEDASVVIDVDIDAGVGQITLTLGE